MTTLPFSSPQKSRGLIFSSTERVRKYSIALVLAWLSIACGDSDGNMGGETNALTPDAGHTQDALSDSNQRALMSRWNDAVDAVKPAIDFHWSSFDEFLHPTYKMGTAAAYEQFAAVLLKFLQDNAEFLESSHLFQTELHYMLLHDTHDFGTVRGPRRADIQNHQRRHPGADASGARSVRARQVAQLLKT